MIVFAVSLFVCLICFALLFLSVLEPLSKKSERKIFIVAVIAALIIVITITIPHKVTETRNNYPLIYLSTSQEGTKKIRIKATYLDSNKHKYLYLHQSDVVVESTNKQPTITIIERKPIDCFQNYFSINKPTTKYIISK